ncbi:MAG: hypothetical protein ACHQYP_12315 [Nitrospiria bacterium]|jgi:hypothetical protein
MKKLSYIGVFILSLLTLPSPGEAAYSYSIEGPYVSFDVGSYTRRIEENCSQCVDPFGNPLLKVYANGDSTRLLAKLGLRAGLLDAYVTVGGATLSIDEFNGFHGKMSPAFGGGINLLMYQSPLYGHFTLFLNPDIIYFKTGDTIQFFSQSKGWITENHDISWTETTVKIGGYSRYDGFAPYGGISLSFVNGQETGDVFGSADIKERDNLGFFLGLNLYFDPAGRAAFFGEIGGGDNNYLKVGIKTRF